MDRTIKYPLYIVQSIETEFKNSAKGEVLTEEEIYCLQLAGFMRGLVTVTYFDNYGSLSELRRVWNPLLQPIMKTDTPAPRKPTSP